jgi:hypothetical protein
MRPHSSQARSPAAPAAIVAIAALIAISACASACAIFAPDPSRDARAACEKKDGPSCFLAGNLALEKNGETADTLRLYTRGCAVRNSPSCEALGNFKGPLREQALVDGCNAGDLVACSRRAGEFPADEAGYGEARALRHRVCKMSSTINSGTPGREVEGIAEACSGLSLMIAAGHGGGRDEVAATKLEVLAMTLRDEAMYRHEREDDAKALPQPAEVQPEAPKKKSGIKKAPKADPTAPDRERFRLDYEARRAAREAWMAAVDSTIAAQQKEVTRGDPSLPSGTPLERALAVLPGATLGGSPCQSCVDGCGTVSRCGGDDFVGGHCGGLRCAPGVACPPFDACVAECAGRVETCSKACGECAEPNGSSSKGAK